MGILILLSAAKEVCHILILQFTLAYLNESITLTDFLKNSKITFKFFFFLGAIAP